MKKTLAFCFAVAVMVACNKDKFQTKPQIKIKSTNTDIVPVNGTLRVTLEFTDKEGDVSDSLLLVRERLNSKAPVRPAPSPYKLPTFPKSQEGEIEVDLDYQSGLIFGINPIVIPGTSPKRYEPDTMNLKFVVRDKGGNKSDTASLGVIVIR
jgi:hypothetical protein